MEQFGLSIEIPSVVCEETFLANEEYFLSKSNPMSSVNTNKERERERPKKKLVNSYVQANTPKFNFKDGEPCRVSQTGFLSDLKSFGRHVIESSKAPANVGHCIMNLIRMKSEFYHNISPCCANLS